MSTLSLSFFEKLHEAAPSINIGTKSMLNGHPVGKLDAMTGTMLKLYRRQVGTRLGSSSSPGTNPSTDPIIDPATDIVV